jgi:hypothetical protein
LRGYLKLGLWEGRNDKAALDLADAGVEAFSRRNRDSGSHPVFVRTIGI